MKQLESWTCVDDPASIAKLRAFSGTARYTATFDKPLTVKAGTLS